MEKSGEIKKSFADLCGIIARLRAPDGCPWDREQTHQSLKKHMIEEAYEAAETFDGSDGAKMADELGDVLLQVVLHAQIGAEAGEFTIDDVTDAVCEKMIARHPHIFGEAKADTAEEVLDRWDEIKRRERGQETLSQEMEGVSKALPALTRGEKLYKKAVKRGFSEIPNTGDFGYEMFLAMKKAVDAGRDPEEEFGIFLKKYIKFVKKFEENTCNCSQNVLK